MLCVKFKVRIFACSALKSISAPGSNLKCILRYLCIPVLGRKFSHLHFFNLITSQTVIKNYVSIDLKFSSSQCFDALQKLVFCAIFCANRTLLFKLSKVVKIVNSVTDISFTINSFVTGRNPNTCKPFCRKCPSTSA